MYRWNEGRNSISYLDEAALKVYLTTKEPVGLHDIRIVYSRHCEAVVRIERA